MRSGLWAICLALLVSTAQAQAEARARITTPHIESFPLVETYLDVYTADGSFLHGLQPSQVSILEDEQPVQNVALQEIRPGVQLVVAINPGSAIALRNSQGISRYGLIRQTLGEWSVARAGSSIDDLSLLVTDGSGISHTQDPQTWFAALPAELDNARQAIPSLDNLSQAVDLAADPTQRAGMGRAVLWITPPIDDYQNPALEDVFSRANQQNIHIHIWLVTADAGTSLVSQRLNELATSRGGHFFQYTGQEILPDLEIYLEPLRSIYRLTYTSQVRQSGTHQVSVTIQNDSQTISTLPQSYTVSLQAPNPAFINPPLEITRQPPENLSMVGAADIPTAEYSPAMLELQILVDFPDQRMRNLVRSALLVDGAVVDENLSPPFDTFQWDLRSVTQSADHTLQVIAEDVLGLSGSSIDTVIKVNVKRPAMGFWMLLARNTPTMIGLAVLLSAGVVLLLMVVGGRIQPRRLPISRLRRPTKKLSPSNPDQSAGQQPDQPWTSRLHWPQRRVKLQAEAYLTPLERDDSSVSSLPIALTASEITIGSDPQRATLVLDDPSIDGYHARLVKNESGVYILSDAGSTAGTWVNFTLLPLAGVCLEHNDLIHFGRSYFRFTHINPPHLRRPVIRLLDKAAPSLTQGEDE